MIKFKIVNTSFLKTRARVVTAQNVGSVVVGLREAWIPLWRCWWSSWAGQSWRQLPVARALEQGLHKSILKQDVKRCS